MSNAPIIYPLFNYDYLTNSMCQSLGYPINKLNIHQFPDKEIVIRIDEQIKGKEVVFVGSLDQPNLKMATLLFAAETARELGATKVSLIAPYLSYMRQDKKFHSGEGVTSKYFANFISHYFDWLLTIDPHLHRWHSLNEIYNIPTTVLHATSCISLWIKNNVSNPILIGPDIESAQWVAEIANEINIPFLILEKIRKGDQLVEVSIPKIEFYENSTPVLVDDIISTAATMIETAKHLQSLKMKKPICIGVHAIFAGNAYNDLLKNNVEKIVTCNTIQHQTNAIDVSDIINKSLTEIRKLN